MANDEWHHWKLKVDTLCIQALGLDTESLPDFRWRQSFYKNKSAWDTVNDAVDYWKEEDPNLETAWNVYLIKEIPHG